MTNIQKFASQIIPPTNPAQYLFPREAIRKTIDRLTLRIPNREVIILTNKLWHLPPLIQISASHRKDGYRVAFINPLLKNITVLKNTNNKENSCLAVGISLIISPLQNQI
jgi:hypothetical protein